MKIPNNERSNYFLCRLVKKIRMFDFSNGKIKELLDLFDKTSRSAESGTLQYRDVDTPAVFIIDILENINNVLLHVTCSYRRLISRYLENSK